MKGSEFLKLVLLYLVSIILKVVTIFFLLNAITLTARHLNTYQRWQNIKTYIQCAWIEIKRVRLIWKLRTPGVFK